MKTIAITICGIAALLIITMHMVRYKESKLVPFIKMAVAPFTIIGLVLASLTIFPTLALKIVLTVLSLMTLIFVHEGYIHYLLLRKGYPILKGRWFYIPLKEVKKLPDMAPGFKKEARSILLQKIRAHDG